MPPQTPELSEVLELALEDFGSQLNTAEPGVIVSFNRDTLTANVQPSIKAIARREDGTEFAHTKPVVPNVPLVMFGSGADFGITVPIKKGHTVLLVYCGPSLDAWKFTSNKLVAPKNFKPNALANAVAIVGLRTMVAADAAAATYVDEDTMCLNAPKVCLGGFTSNIDKSVARREDLELIVDKLNDLIDIYKAHTHLLADVPTTSPVAEIPPLTTMDVPDCSDVTQTE